MKNQYAITDSEWVILRILLNQSPLGSKAITELVKVQNDWSNATVKTFLSRLVAKGIINYKKEKNAYVYYPIVTEMTYVRNEMRSFYAKIYGEVIHYETEHFQFSGHQDIDYMTYLGAMLEAYYEKVSKDLEIELESKQIIYIYASLKGLHSALGYEDGPAWLKAGWFWEIVHLAPKECFDGSRAESAAFHVFTQLLIHYINPRAPFWLLQGVSVYESDWLTEGAIRNAIAGVKERLNVNTIFRISTDDDLFKIQYGYELTYTVIAFIVECYGMDRLNSYLRTPEQLTSIFTCSEEEFWQSWLMFIKEKYLDEK